MQIMLMMTYYSVHEKKLKIIGKNTNNNSRYLSQNNIISYNNNYYKEICKKSTYSVFIVCVI